uniref:Uncharacterized protein n=1 Tax=Meloidogyne hapla TaxID=6305 RepID=A0A1I8BQU8_MELHA
MLLSCIRQRPVTTWRSDYGCDINEVFSMPFGDDLCERCIQIKSEKTNEGEKKIQSNSKRSNLVKTRFLNKVRLKRFPRLDDGPESTDEEGESEFHAKKLPNPLLDGEIIETAPKMPITNSGRRQRAVRFSENQEQLGDYGGEFYFKF